jgi:hypothetical protein
MIKFFALIRPDRLSFLRKQESTVASVTEPGAMDFCFRRNDSKKT